MTSFPSEEFAVRGASGDDGRSEPVLGAYGHTVKTVRGASQIYGMQPQWRAPVAVFDAIGFGEEAWIASLPITTLSIRLSGAKIRCDWGSRKGAINGPNAGFALGVKGSPNHFSAQGRVRFAQIYLADSLIYRCAHALKPGATASGGLRPDLTFIPDNLLQNLIVSYIEATTRSPTALEMEARTILMVERLLSQHHGLAKSASADVRGQLAPWHIRRTIEYLHANMNANVSLATLAALVDLSPFHFARGFKRSVGKSPQAYHSALRLDKAKQLLVETEESVTDIALLVGYEAPQTLARVFRREVGTTPTIYRREQRL